MDFKRTAGFAGVLAVIFWVLSLVFAGATPSAEDSINDIGEYLSSDVGMHKLGLLFGVIAVVPFIVFLAGFLVPFMKADRENGEAYSIVIFGGALLLGAHAAIAEGALGALLLRGLDGLDAPTVRGLWDLQQVSYGAAGISFAVFAGGIAMAVLRRHVMADWVGWLATVWAVTGALGLFALTSDGNAALLAYVPFILFLVFILAVSIDTVRSPSSAPSS